MKVGLLGNMNNNFFALTRYLRDSGLDARLLYTYQGEHFMPWCDTYTLEYVDYCEPLDWDPRTFYRSSVADIRQRVRGYDALIVCGYPAAFLQRAGIPIDVYIPYGSDLYKYAYLPAHFSTSAKILNYLRKRWVRRKVEVEDMSFGTVHGHLREGIRNAHSVIWPDTNPEMQSRYDGLHIRGKRLNSAVPFIYHPQYCAERMPQWFDRSHWSREFEEIRKASDLVVFHHSRHIWRTHANAFSFKGNDRLLRGFAGFVRSHPGVKACLVTIEYGLDVDRSRALVRDLGIEANVKWFPKMYRKDLMVGLYLADICTGEFDMSWLMFGTIGEGMALGKPILHYRDDSLYRDSWDDLYPLMSAREPHEIQAALDGYWSDRAAHDLMGARSREWFLRHVVAEPLRQIRALLS